jgi:hypothetical protein
MPWRIKREFYLILLGCASITLGIVVVARDKSVDTKLLGIVAVIGGIAIILNLLPTNGHSDE